MNILSLRKLKLNIKFCNLNLLSILCPPLNNFHHYITLVSKSQHLFSVERYSFSNISIIFLIYYQNLQVYNFYIHFFPILLVPSIRRAVLPLYLSFHSNKHFYSFLSSPPHPLKITKSNYLFHQIITESNLLL